MPRRFKRAVDRIGHFPHRLLENRPHRLDILLRDILVEVASIRSTASGPRLNGSVFLENGVTVLDDAAIDHLTSAAGVDWFLFTSGQV